MAPSLRSILLALTMALLGTVPSSALARAPRIVSTTVDNPSFGGVANTMMYTVTVTVDGTGADADHGAKVGFTDLYTSCTDPTTVWKWAPSQTFDTTDTRTWTLYNFQPGTTYYYKVRVGGARSRISACGVLTTTLAATPTIPPDLANLDIEFSKPGDPPATKYVIMETGDCGRRPSGVDATDYLLALDVEHESIVWYLDVPATSGISGAETNGWRYQPATTATAGLLLVMVDHRYLYEWSFDGTELQRYDFAPNGECDNGTGPCVHHDVYRSEVTGRTHVLASAQTAIDSTGTAWDAACAGTGSLFVDDGIITLAEDGTVYSDYSLMNDYGFDPIDYGGPNAAPLAGMGKACNALQYHEDFEFDAIDWTHVNSIAASSFGTAEVLDVSLKAWDAVLRFDASTGTRLWTLASNSTDGDFLSIDLATGIAGETTFADQHDVHEVSENELMMFDNRGDSTGARVLRLALDYPGGTATIDRNWVVVDEAGTPLSCPVEGSGQEVPGTDGEHVLANCNDENTIVELSDGTGATGSPPPLVISLPDVDWCAARGPLDRQDIWGWHRAFPAVSIGAF